MPPRVDLTGQKFGRLTVVGISHRDDKKRRYFWKCLCDCGNERIVRVDNLKNKSTDSCEDCSKKEIQIKRAKLNDITGNRYGRLVVISFSHKDDKYFSYWLCKCDCGNEKIINQGSLLNGSTSSCGCLSKELSVKRNRERSEKEHDLTGLRFNRLLVLSLSHRNEKGNTFWLCKCDCGTEKIISGQSLKSKNSQSCGCLNKERIKETKIINLVGQKFGKLTVISYSHSKNKRPYWVCLCECGNEKITNGSSLKRGDTISCGCAYSENLEGQRFGRLIVIRFSERSKTGQFRWLCKCDCGNEKVVLASNLKKGNVKSCGCIAKEMIGKNHPNYNFNKTAEERIVDRSYTDYYFWRKNIYERDNYTCQFCGQYGGKLNAHHKKSYHCNKELRTDIDNGITLCESCHKKFHKEYGKLNNTEFQLNEFLIRMKGN